MMFYNEANAHVRQFEVIFVSSDKTEEEFNEYFTEMPWLALPYHKRIEAEGLKSKLDVQVIPHLVLIDNEGI